MKIRMSIMAASIAAMGMFSGCSDSSLGSQTFGVNLTAVDGYVVKLNSAASAGCWNSANIDYKIFYSAAGILTPNGKIPFEIEENYGDCHFNIPSDAILDSDGNGIYTTADTKQVGFPMYRYADLSGFNSFLDEIEDVLVTPLTTYVAAKKDAGDPVSDTLAAIINDFNVMESVTNLTTDNTSADYADTMQLTTFQNAITTTLSVTNSINVLTDINTTTLEADLLNNIAVPNVTDMFSGVTGIDTTAIESDINATVTVLETFNDIAAAGTVDFSALYTQIVDEEVDFSTALATSATTTITDATLLATIDNIEGNITAAATDLDTLIAATPANLSLGDTLKLGTTDVTLSTTGTFATTITVNSSTTVADFSKIVLPSASISKSFADENVSVEVTIVNQADSTDVLKAKFGQGNTITLAPNDANTSVNTTIYTSTPISITVDVNGTRTVDYGITAGVDKTNTDLTFDACSFVDCTDSRFDDINAYLQVPGKSYDVNITVKGISSSNLTTDYESALGTVTTK